MRGRARDKVRDRVTFALLERGIVRKRNCLKEKSAAEFGLEAADPNHPVTVVKGYRVSFSNPAPHSVGVGGTLAMRDALPVLFG